MCQPQESTNERPYLICLEGFAHVQNLPGLRAGLRNKQGRQRMGEKMTVSTQTPADTRVIMLSMRPSVLGEAEPFDGGGTSLVLNLNF